ncbi:MAG: YoaK family protein [Candidatus Acidiferrales bacterium]
MPTSQKAVSTEWRRAGALALVSGYVDSYTLLKFGVFASFMSGNTTVGGSQAGQAKLAAAGHSFLPIPVFLLGIFLGTLVVQTGQRHQSHRLFALVAAMLTVGSAAAYWTWPGWMCIMILSSAMGILNTSITHVGGQTVSLGFVTGDLNSLAQHVALGIRRAPLPEAQGSWDTRWARATLLAGIWTAFLGGAILGSALVSRLTTWTLLVPSLILLALPLVDRPTQPTCR